jgi:cysteine desulfurase/selenocysteine lyase
MPPWQGGGDMIESVSFEKTTWNQLPYKFEAGTPSIAQAIGLGAALEFYMTLPHQKILRYEDELRLYAEEQLVKLVPGLHIIGRAKEKCSIVSFVLDNVHPHDIGTFTGQAGIAIRTGHHCAQPVMTRFKVPATARASFSFYNKKEEIDLLCQSLKKTVEFFQ